MPSDLILSDENAHWKYFIANFLRISHMQLGKLSLVVDYVPGQIDRSIPTFHR